MIFDSSDIAYLYEDGLPDTDNYYGELWYQYEYKKQKTEWFRWLYVDQEMLKEVADSQHWLVEILYEDGYDQYLAKLTYSPLSL